MDSRRQRIALARKKKLLIHAAAQAQRAVDYVLRRRSDRWFTIIAKLFEQARARSLSLHSAESETLDDSLSSLVRGSLESARTPPKLHRSRRGYPPERNGFPPQSLRSDCARSGKIHAGGQLISHPV